jgi:methionyl-tRNA formyltransferase
MARHNLLIFSGINRRYKYLMNKILDRYPEADLVVQKNIKGDYRGMYDNDVRFDHEAIQLVNSHLEKRDEVEARYYPEDVFHINENNRVLEVTSDTLNSKETVDFIKENKPAVVFSFGAGLLKKNVLEALKNRKAVNLHLGLSPYYRSSDTLLWPLYLQNPGHVGITLHKLERSVDNGPIYHQQRTEFCREDFIHDIFCKTITQAVEPTLRLIEGLMAGREPRSCILPEKGKFFLKGEFTPSHLKTIYKLVQEGMLSKYLDGKWPTREIKLYSCFDQ